MHSVLPSRGFNKSVTPTYWCCLVPGQEFSNAIAKRLYVTEIHTITNGWLSDDDLKNTVIIVKRF